MVTEAKPLPEGFFITSFNPDPSASWLVAYAGPCGDDECNEHHARIYLIPMIGWLSVEVPIPGEEEAYRNEIRPAVMTAGGLVRDYLAIADDYRLLAVLRATDDVIAIAREIYHDRFNDEPPLIVETGPAN